MFLDYGGDKRFVVKGYVDASFDTDPDDSKSQSGYIWKVGAISYSSSMKSIVDIQNLQNTYGSECGKPLTKLLSQAKHDHTLVLFGC